MNVFILQLTIFAQYFYPVNTTERNWNVKKQTHTPKYPYLIINDSEETAFPFSSLNIDVKNRGLMYACTQTAEILVTLL